MSRRDTIIIAVLVNAGLLMVLFATAMRSGKKEEKQALELVETTNAQQSTLATNDQLLSPLPAETNLLDAPISDVSALPAEVLASAEEIEIPVATQNIAPVPVASVEKPVVEAKSEPAAVAATITVKKGDVLEKIAKSHQTSVAAIMKANNLQSTNLKIGQVLKMPSGAAKKESASTPASTGESYYTVKEGDSPWLIATRNHVKLDELLKLNNMDEQKAKKLRPGDRLRLR